MPAAAVLCSAPLEQDVRRASERTGPNLKNPSTSVDAQLAGLQLYSGVGRTRTKHASRKWPAEMWVTAPARTLSHCEISEAEQTREMREIRGGRAGGDVNRFHSISKPFTAG